MQSAVDTTAGRSAFDPHPVLAKDVGGHRPMHVGGRKHDEFDQGQEFIPI